MTDDGGMLARIRKLLLALLAAGSLGTAVELLLLGHFEEFTQIVPLVLLAAGLAAASWHLVSAGASVAAGKVIGSFTTVDLTWRWQVFDETTVSLALYNLFDEDPPFARLDQNFDPFTASPLGFTAKLGVNQAF